MQRPLQITIRDIPESEAIETYIREKAEKLEEHYSQIVGAHVVIEMPHKHKHQGKLFTIRLTVKVPGDEIVINRDRNEDIYVSLRDAFDAMKRALEDYSRRQSGEIKTHDLPQHGFVAKLFEDEGYGFIETPSGDEIYFHKDNVVSPAFERLGIGDKVQFLAEVAGEGLQAKRVSVGKHNF